MIVDNKRKEVFMKRVLCLVLLFAFIGLPVSPLFAQSNYRVPTQADQAVQGPAPSFRGGERMPIRIPPIGQGLGTGTGLQMPSGGGAGAAGGDAGGMGGAALAVMGYQVHVLGEVMRPGTYRVMASERIAEAIQRAGGLANNGSERKIELRRKGGGVTRIDLVEFKLFGKLEDNPYLTDNDVVFVPLRDKIVQVVGAVKRPDVYELNNEKTLIDVVELGGGFNAATALKEPIRIIRFVDGEKSVNEIPIEKDKMSQVFIQNGDVVVVPNTVTQKTEFDYNVASIPGDQIFYPSYEDRVFVLGGVAYPGAYPFSPYYSVNQYLSLAGGVTEKGVIGKYRIIAIDGKSRRVKENERVNPGDTLMVKERVMTPVGWTGFAMGLASFGLSATATVLALTTR